MKTKKLVVEIVKPGTGYDIGVTVRVVDIGRGVYAVDVREMGIFLDADQVHPTTRPAMFPTR